MVQVNHFCSICVMCLIQLTYWLLNEYDELRLIRIICIDLERMKEFGKTIKNYNKVTREIERLVIEKKFKRSN